MEIEIDKYYLDDCENIVGPMIEIHDTDNMFIFCGDVNGYRQYYTRDGQYCLQHGTDNLNPGKLLKEYIKADATQQITEGIKHDEDKPMLALLPIVALIEVGKVMTFGAKKYTAHNWLSGLTFTRLSSATLRHLFAWLSGEDLDKESGINHLAHCAACILMMLELVLRGRKDLDDRYKGASK